MTKRIPPTFALMGIRWRTKRVSTKTLGVKDDGDTVDGDCDERLKVVRVRHGLQHDYAWATFIHEVLHALDGQTQSDESDDDAIERFIERIDEPLYVFLRDTFNVGR